MKDDFYKDMNHKRADEEKPDKTDSKNGNKDGERQTLSRSARHKNKDNQKEGNPKKNNSAKEKKNKNEDSLTDKIQAYFSSENNQKRKAAFIGTLKGYQNRIKNELKVSKEKLGGIGNQTKAKANTKKKSDNNEGRKLPWILGLLVLIPITLLLAFLIFSNFWPSLDDEIELASSESEETNEAEENNNTAEFNAELEEQKKEHERRLAEGRNNTSSSEDLKVNYSEEELEALESESRNAIQDKESDESSSNDQENTEDSNTEENSNESESASEDTQTEDSTNNENQTEANTEANQETEVANQETEENQTTNANASHTVTTEDNLYRIAIQYYGDGSSENVQRIREANGISENEISVGQQLIIP